LFSPAITSLDPETGQGDPMATYAFATQGALVSVDVHSGQVEVLDMIACHDVGKAVNPAAVTGQIEGAISMGIGFGLMEEVKMQNGVIQNPNLSQYYMPTSLDMPDISASYVETAEASGPFGAKGLGEPALVPTAPAILNAISAATGVRPEEMPVTPEVLWNLLKKQETS
jgi:CO/xanthine dehydrogenase Mo-binding subunit